MGKWRRSVFACGTHLIAQSRGFRMNNASSAESGRVIAMGALDTPIGAKIALHIFTAEKDDYYDI